MKSLCRLMALATLAGGLAAVPASGQVVISQVFGVPTGGTGGSTYSYEVDYIELFNRGNTPVDMSGWSVQAEWLGDWEVIPLTGTLQPGQFFLIQVYERQPGTTNTGAPLPTPDLIAQASGGGFNNPDSTWLSGSQGGVALMSNTLQIASDTCPDSDPALLDLVAWGSTILTCGTNITNAPSQSNFLALFRKNGGCADTGSSIADFELKTPNPRNTSMVFPYYATVGATPTPPAGTTKVTASISPFVCGATATLSTAVADLSSIGGSPSASLLDNGTGGDVASGDGTFSLNYTLPGAVAVGQYAIPVTLTDASSNVRVVNAALNVAIVGDACQTAKPIGPLPFNDAYTTADFTDDNLIVPCRSVLTPTVSRNGVWYSITPATDMTLRVTKNSTLFNFSLYTGTCSSLTIIDCDDSNSAANWRLTAGVTYYMLSMFDSSGSPTTNATLGFTAITSPSNDICSGAIDLNAQTLPYVDSNVQQFHDATGDADNSCDNSPVVTRRGVWYTYLPAVDSILRTVESSSRIIVSSSLWTGTCPGGVSFVSCSGSESTSYYLNAGQRYWVLIGSNSTAQPGTTTDAYSNTFTVTAPPANDLCGNAVDLGSLATPLAINPGPVLSTASSDTTPCATATFGVWYRFTAPAAGLLRLNESSSIDVSWAVLPSCGSSTSNLCTTTDTDQFLSMTAGQQVVILLYSSSTATTATNLTFEFIPPLANDVCAGAFDLTAQAFPYVATMDARNSTVHDIDQGSCTTRSDTQYGVWFKYTAPSSGILTMVESSGASVDFGMFSVDNPLDICGTLGASVGCSDDSDAGAFQVLAGQTYAILAGNGSGTGQPSAAYSITFNLESSLLNDVCGTATNISNLLPYNEVVNSFLAQHEPDVSCNPATATDLFNGVWYTITPNQNMNVTIWDSNQASMNVTVYTSCGGSEVYCETNDVTYSLTAGQTYYFLVGRNLISSAAPNSVYNIHFAQSQPLTHDLCDNAFHLDAFPFSTIIDITTATADAPSGVSGSTCNTSTATVVQNSVWYRIHTLTAGVLTGAIEPDLGRAGTGVAAVYESSDGTCAGINPTPIWCGNDPSSPVSTPISVNAALNAGTVYYLQVGTQGTSAVTADVVFSVDLQFSGTIDPGTQTCCRGTTCNPVAAGTCTGSVAGSNSLVVSSCGAGGSFASCCYADFNHDGIQSIDDLFLYFNAYFTSSPYANVGGDGVATPTIDDLFLYINAYFGTCS